MTPSVCGRCRRRILEILNNLRRSDSGFYERNNASARLTTCANADAVVTSVKLWPNGSFNLILNVIVILNKYEQTAAFNNVQIHTKEHQIYLFLCKYTKYSPYIILLIFNDIKRPFIFHAPSLIFIHSLNIRTHIFIFEMAVICEKNYILIRCVIRWLRYISESRFDVASHVSCSLFIAIIVYNRCCLTIRSLLGRSCSAFTHEAFRKRDRDDSPTLLAISLPCTDFVCSHNFFSLSSFPLFICTERSAGTPLNRSVIYWSYVMSYACHMPVICFSSPRSSAFHYLTLMHSPWFTILSPDFSEAKFRPAFKFPMPLCRLCWFCYWISDIKWNLSSSWYTSRESFLLIKVWTRKQNFKNFNLILRFKV